MKTSRATLVFRASASCSKILNVKDIFNTVENFRATLFFQDKRKLLKNRDIHLGAIRVIWASVVCNLTKVVIGYSDFDLAKALVFCKHRTIGCR